MLCWIPLYVVWLGPSYRLIVPDATNPALLGTTIERWAFYWSVFQSMVHFYYDGFLWKMRLPSVQANL